VARKPVTVTVTALRHVAFEDLGILEDLFAARGWAVTYIEAPVADWSKFDPLAPDLLVVLGGPIGVYEEEIYPFLTVEIAAIKTRLEAGKPTLGLCLGAQLIATALGSDVYPGSEKEIGWKPLLLTDAGGGGPIRHLAAEHTFMFHWHGDTFDLPKDAVLLAGTEVCPNQIFTWGESTLAFQCHPEVRARDLEKWFVGHAVEIAAAKATNVPHLRDGTRRYGTALEQQGKKLFGEWLDSLKL
jgi:GMP synthase (glutamine-hydrolysing)